MPSLVTRFHFLVLAVTLAAGAVAWLHSPADFQFAAHWHRSTVDWLWPRDIALLTPPLAQLSLMLGFHLLGRELSRNHLAKTRHILDPLLTLFLVAALGCQMGLLFMTIGSDLDLFRGSAVALAGTLLIIGVVLFSAERHTYAGLRLPWPIRSDNAWRWTHRLVGALTVAGAILLAGLAFIDAGPGVLVIAIASILLGLPPLAFVATALLRRL